MAWILLFGTKMEFVDGTSVSPPDLPDYKVAKWKVALSADATELSLDVQVTHRTSGVGLVARWTMRGGWIDSQSDGEWRLADEAFESESATFQVTSGKPVAAGFNLRIGALVLRSTRVRISSVGGIPSFGEPDRPLQPLFSNIPFAMGARGPVGVQVVLLEQQLNLVVPDHGLEAQALYLPPSGAPFAASPPLSVAAFNLPIATTQGTQELRFCADPLDSRPISLDVDGSTPRPGLTVRDADLVCRISRGSAAGPMVLEGLRLVPRGEETLIRLEWQGLRMAANKPWSLLVGACDVRLRPKTKGRGGTWMAAPGETEATVAWPAVGEEVLVGYSQGVRVDLRGAPYSPTSSVILSTKLLEASSHPNVAKDCLAGGGIVLFRARQSFALLVPREHVLSPERGDTGHLKPVGQYRLVPDGDTGVIAWPIVSGASPQLTSEERKLWCAAVADALTRLRAQAPAESPQYSREGLVVDYPIDQMIEVKRLVAGAEPPRFELGLGPRQERRRLAAWSLANRVGVEREVRRDAILEKDYWLFFPGNGLPQAPPQQEPIRLDSAGTFLLPPAPEKWFSPSHPAAFPTILYKQTDSRTVWQILAAHFNTTQLEGLEDLANESLLPRTWTGLVLFSPQGAIDGSFDNPLRLILGKEVPFRFIALSERQDGRLEVALARASFKNQSISSPPWEKQSEEAYSYLSEFDVLIRDGRLVAARAHATVFLRSLLGVSLTDKNGKTATLELVGSLDREQGTFVLRAQPVTDADLPIPPKTTSNKWWPLAAFRVNQAEVGTFVADGETGVCIGLSGILRLKKRTWLFSFDEEQVILFDQLLLVTIAGSTRESPANVRSGPGRTVATGTVLGFEYGGLRLAGGQIAARLCDSPVAALRLATIQVRFSDDGGSPATDSWLTALVPLGSTDRPQGGFVGFEFAMHWVDRSMMGSPAGEAIEFRIGLALPTDQNGSPTSEDAFVGARAIGVSRLSLDLFRFLSLSTDRLEVGKQSNLPWLSLLDASLSTPWGQLFGAGTARAAIFFDGRGHGGFVAVWRAANSGANGVSWLLVGRNIAIDQDAQAELLSPKVPGAETQEQAARLERLFQDKRFLPLGTPDVGAWAIGVGFSALPWFTGKALFQEGRLPGLVLGGGYFSMLFATEGLSLAYCPGRTADQDRFAAQIALPQFAFGRFRFTGAAIRIEVEPDGDFLIDVGFPWPLPGGGRDWFRTIGLIVTPGQASGGLYLRRRGLASLDQVSIGLAVQWGVGIQVNVGSWIRGYARLGWFAILEGTAIVHDECDVSLQRLAGAGGVVAQIVVEVSVWIISARFAATASAEAAMEARPYARFIRLLDSPPLPSAAGHVSPCGEAWAENSMAPLVIDMRFELSFRATFSVSVNCGLFTVTRSVGVEFAVELKGSITV